jgi:hypothetical protein
VPQVHHAAVIFLEESQDMIYRHAQALAAQATLRDARELFGEGEDALLRGVSEDEHVAYEIMQEGLNAVA